MDDACWASGGVGVETQYSTASSWRPCFLFVMFYLLLLWLPILAFSVPGYSNLFTGSVLNVLDLYIKYTAEVVRLRTYIVWFTSENM